MVRLTDHPDMTLDVYRGCKTTIQQQQSDGFADNQELKWVSGIEVMKSW